MNNLRMELSFSNADSLLRGMRLSRPELERPQRLQFVWTRRRCFSDLRGESDRPPGHLEDLLRGDTRVDARHHQLSGVRVGLQDTKIGDDLRRPPGLQSQTLAMVSAFPMPERR